MSIADDSVKKVKRLGRGLSSLIGEPVPVDPKIVSNNSLASATVDVAPATMGVPSGGAEVGGGVVMVGVEEIGPNRHQPRRVFDQVALDRLADSIKRSGMMQPVILRPGGSGGPRYELVAGERRWRAAKIAGLERVPALVRPLGDEEAAEWALVENVQREDLNPMERAWAFRALAEKFGLTQAQIAERVGLDRSSVANTMRLTELEEPIREMIAMGRLNAGHGKALLGAPAGPGRIRLAEQASDEGWSVRRLERAAVAMLADLDKQIHAARVDDLNRMPLSPARAARLDLERQLSEHLGTKVTITTGRSSERGKMTIEFYGLDHFDGLLAKMGFRAR